MVSGEWYQRSAVQRDVCPSGSCRPDLHQVYIMVIKSPGINFAYAQLCSPFPRRATAEIGRIERSANFLFDKDRLGIAIIRGRKCITPSFLPFSKRSDKFPTLSIERSLSYRRRTPSIHLRSRASEGGETRITSVARHTQHGIIAERGRKSLTLPDQFVPRNRRVCSIPNDAYT